ncbi:pyroglutamyl-peptidase I [Alicyclobacillus fodiniaquatilis]|jgi:pyroglutamyl-peptidase|uniref:Pyrrolidone-carboxylate peptidase n=1 Tax=Alicyclobacillus fodiniaquatilis TaxID=1661150 RepID=A0ABW4JB29_9BACL
MRNILITGFEPFGGEVVNPSWEVARHLDERSLEDAYVIHAVQLPTAFHAAKMALELAIDRLLPEVIVCLGEAGGRAQLTPERVAINVMDASIPDNEGDRPIDEPIDEAGPVAYWSTLPIKAMVTAMRAANVPAAVSNTAGTYVCNSTFYALMHYVSAQKLHTRAGFIHVPYMPEQTLARSAPALPVETMVKGIIVALQAVVQTAEDLPLADGQTH